MREWCGGEGVEKGDGRRETGERRKGKEGKVEGEEVASTFCIMATIYAHVNPICTHTHRALQSATISMYGEALYLRSFSELERSLLCSYGL